MQQIGYEHKDKSDDEKDMYKRMKSMEKELKEIKKYSIKQIIKSDF